MSRAVNPAENRIRTENEKYWASMESRIGPSIVSPAMQPPVVDTEKSTAIYLEGVTGEFLGRGAYILSCLGFFFVPLALVGWICGLAAMEMSGGRYGKKAAMGGMIFVSMWTLGIAFIFLLMIAGNIAQG
jgi:hypothetical protein